MPAGADRTPSRKADHLRINVESDVAAKGITAGFERYCFENRALPEIDLKDVDLSIEFLGRRLRAPILISCMTGGTPEARRINRALAEVAQRHGLAMGLGSGRALVESPATLDTFAVRDLAPGVPILANLGAVQLKKGFGARECRKLVELLDADALVLHLNALQEALQPEGDTEFSGILAAIARLCRELETPVIVKEVGWGIGASDARALFDAGVAGVDVAGAGGTSWSEVERYRISPPWRAQVAAEFAGWGIPTAEAIRQARAAVPNGLLIASGGIGEGMHVAKAIALGADLAGIAGAFLRAAHEGVEPAAEYAQQLIEVLRVAMFALGIGSVAELKGTPLLRLGRSAGRPG